MGKGNVLVIGNSGVGKSTLINAVLGEACAETNWGPEGTTRALKLYETDGIPFRIIDTAGFEPSFFKEQQAIRAVKKWSADSAKAGQEDHGIDVIWFCVDGTSRKLFSRTISDLSRATAMWRSVPILVVITKSYSIPERQENIEMVRSAFARQKHRPQNVKKILPVVAATYVLNESAYAPPEGISELIDATNALMPEGVRAKEQDVAAFKLNRCRAVSQSVIAAATAAAVVVGAVPIPFADALILSPIEVAEVNALAQVYGIRKEEKSRKFLSSIVEVGTVSAAAKTAIGALQMIPGINLGASLLNAVIAGGIAAALGEGSMLAFEQVYLGNRSMEDLDWVKKLMESELSGRVIRAVNTAAAKITQGMDGRSTAKIILRAVQSVLPQPDAGGSKKGS